MNSTKINIEVDIKKFNYANTFLTYLFIFFDFITLIICFFILKSKNKNAVKLKFKFILFIIINIIVRFLSLSKYNNIKTLFKEFIFTLINSYQFFLMISFIVTLIEDILISGNNSKNLEKVDIIQFCVAFFFITISYDNFLFSFSKKNIYLIQYIITLICIFKLFRSLKNVLIEAVQCSRKNYVKKEKIYSYMKMCLYISFVLFFIYYLMKILSIFINNSLYIIYIQMFLIVIKEGAIYLIFLIFGAIIYILNKNIRLNNIRYNNYDNDEKISIYMN